MKYTLAILAMTILCLPVRADEPFEHPPINYGKAERKDPITLLQQKLDSGKAKLKYDDKTGYLKAVLDALKIPVSSQMLVHSKTSFQLRRISPSTPRAVYFSDDMYVGWVQNGDVVEISSVDPNMGSMFYALEQKRVNKPKFTRMTHRCFQCHASSMTQGVPGHLVRSVYTDEQGFPVFKAGTFRIDQTSPFSQRWGGWYVTGTHGKQRHLGNVLVSDPDNAEDVDTERGANVSDLRRFINTRPYLSPHSDIVALMVMEHQATMHNLITHANYQTRFALRDHAIISKALGEDPSELSPSTKRRIASASNRLIAYMLFSEEAPLKGKITGTSGFATEFTARGLRDKQGRSLREFDMETRMFRYPCSYLIHSDAFAALPAESKNYIYQRLWEILTAKKAPEGFEHLSDDDRGNIRQILIDTLPNLPAYWKSRA